MIPQSGAGASLCRHGGCVDRQGKLHLDATNIIAAIITLGDVVECNHFRGPHR